MSALHLVTEWPVDHVGAAIVTSAGVDHVGDLDRIYRLASLTKPITAWAGMVGVEEGVIDLDAPLQHVSALDRATMRHCTGRVGAGTAAATTASNWSLRFTLKLPRPLTGWYTMHRYMHRFV